MKSKTLQGNLGISGQRQGFVEFRRSSINPARRRQGAGMNQQRSRRPAERLWLLLSASLCSANRRLLL